ncbi:hypothetical protein SAMN04487783_0802 [Agrococcus baldri]|uniref:Uncharacterized protein n=1 Tax=Agrococcus baldri TaxID=153730 RepID=A0AA94HLY7_9MICO|nr:hypothetical protein [Agrococcus baldri]SFS03912.1 hypothetical protein SAMN04487783_0802 [Agrococcus baldri]
MAAAAMVLALGACAAPTAEPSAPTATTVASAAAGPASPAPTATAEPTASDDPMAGWQAVETSDGLFRWRIPVDWSVVDESFEAEDDLGHVNAITVVSDIGQELAYFGSAYYGDRGGACDDWDGDGTTMVPGQLHADAMALGGDGRVVAYTAQRVEDRFDFVAGFTMDDVEDDRVPCLGYFDVPVPDDHPFTSFSTTHDRALWEVASFAQGAAYAETEEFDELFAMFRSLELLQER